MRIEQLRNETIEQFVHYCKDFIEEVDESYIHDEDLRSFKVNEENPTYLLMEDNGEVIGTVSLIVDSYYRSGKRGRFRIFHGKSGEAEAYQRMLHEILTHTEGLDQLFIHVPEKNKMLAENIKRLGFEVERHSFGMIRENIEIDKPVFPAEFQLKTFIAGRDEEAWCQVRNESFMKLAGSDIPRTPEMVKFHEEDGYIEGGTMLLYHHEKPVGAITVSSDIEEGEAVSYLSAVCVVPECQGKGLGRNLLRAGIRFGKEKGFLKTMLSVNAENEKALELYEKEGFQRNYMSTCYQYKIKR